jgi:exopolysaccharide biosynthesis predicted pyruvyltransferase EpsI
MDDARLLKIFTPSVLERNLYYKHYECHFDWFFDPSYCKLVHVEDYQRMVLRVTVSVKQLYS